jgi:ectoine hydroxylase-related dioxygenase (phytanoyl-CoA dioxygenase family)
LKNITHASHASSLAHLVARAMNVSGLRLYSASVFLKRPGDGLSLWHQDAAAMPLRTDKIATLWVALEDVPVAAGPLRFLKGSHLPGVKPPSLRDLPPRERTAAARLAASAPEVERATGLRATAPRAMTAGDATLHLGWTLHGAEENAAATDRVALAITFFEDGARVEPALLERVPPGGAEAAPSKGVRFRGEDGGELIVHLLDDDRVTWEPWLHARPPLLVPGVPVRHPKLTPLLFPTAANSTRAR